MKIRFPLATLLIAALVPATVHAAKKNKEQKSAPIAAPAAGSFGIPSARIEPLLEPCLNAILAPLDANPKMPRIEVEKLRAAFAADQIKAKTQAEQLICQNAMALCDALTRSMDDRVKAQTDARTSAAVPMRSNATSIVKSSPMKGRDAGANAEAIRKKQKDERKDADKEAQRNVAYMNTAAAKAWTERGPVLRRGLMALFTRQVQLEALEQRNAAIAAQAAEAAKAVAAAKAAEAAKAEAAAKIAAAEKAAKAAADEKVAKARAEAAAKAAAAEKEAKVAQAEAATKAAAAEKAEKEKVAAAKSAALEDSFVGTWTGQAGKKSITVNEDHTAVRVDGKGEETKGAWTVTDGKLRLHWEEGNGIRGKLSEDGQRIEADGGASWFRKKS